MRQLLTKDDMQKRGIKHWERHRSAHANRRGGPPCWRAAPRHGKCHPVAGGALLSHGLPRSTIGAGGLNFRVRDGTGCASPAMAAGHRVAFSCHGRPRVPPGPHSAQRDASLEGSHLVALRQWCGRARAISAARLRRSPALHLPPIDLVVCEGPYRREDSSRDRLPA